MQLSKYTTTALEDWVTKLYIRSNIIAPKDINIERIGRLMGLFIHYKNMPTRYDIFGRYRAININRLIDPYLQKEQFLHELGHILRHVGHQTMMPEAFRELQEWDANHFTLYAALPYHMLKRYQLNDPYIIETLSHDFGITEDLCRTRLTKIKNNIMDLQYNYLAESGGIY